MLRYLWGGLYSCSSEIEEPSVADEVNQAVTRSGVIPAGDSVEYITLHSGLKLAVVDSMYIYQGDIILSPEQFDILSKAGQRSAVKTEFARLWDRGIIPYYLPNNVANRQNALNAIWYISSLAMGVSFVPLTNPSGDYVEFISSNENSANVGRVGGRQLLRFRPDATTGEVMHEIGHVMGLFYEHSREDRDDYVTIHYGNIRSTLVSQFRKYSEDGYQGYDFGTFDFESLMLYGSFDGAVDHSVSSVSPAMTKKDGSTFSPQRAVFSIGDIVGVQFIYGPPFAKLVTTTTLHDVRYNDSFDEATIEYSNIVYFYSDEACTMPVILDQPRLLLVHYLSEEGSQSSVSVLRSVVPAGVSSCEIADTYFYEYNEWENRVDYRSLTSFLSGAAR